MTEGTRRDNLGSWYDHAPCGLLVTDPNGTIVDVNDTIVVWTPVYRPAGDGSEVGGD